MASVQRKEHLNVVFKAYAYQQDNANASYFIYCFHLFGMQFRVEKPTAIRDDQSTLTNEIKIRKE